MYSFFYIISETCSLNGTAFPTATWISTLTHMVSQMHPKDCKQFSVFLCVMTENGKCCFCKLHV